MSRNRDADRARERARDLDTLREAVKYGERIQSNDRRVRRLVKRGWAENPTHIYDLPGVGNATANVTEAGRKEVDG